MKIDGCADLCCGVLHFAEFGCEEAVEIGAGILYANKSALIVDKDPNIDALILFAVDHGTHQVPQHVGEQVFFGDEANPFGNPVDDYVIASHCEGLEADKQLVDQVMEGYFGPVLAGFKGKKGGVWGEAGGGEDGFHKIK